MKINLVFTTTFHPTDRIGTRGNSGDKMFKDDGFFRIEKPLYAVETIRNQLYSAVRDHQAAGSIPVTRTKQP